MRDYEYHLTRTEVEDAYRVPREKIDAEILHLDRQFRAYPNCLFKSSAEYNRKWLCYLILNRRRELEPMPTVAEAA